MPEQLHRPLGTSYVINRVNTVTLPGLFDELEGMGLLALEYIRPHDLKTNQVFIRACRRIVILHLLEALLFRTLVFLRAAGHRVDPLHDYRVLLDRVLRREQVRRTPAQLNSAGPATRWHFATSSNAQIALR